MITGLFNKGALPGLENSIKFRARKHEVISQNIANVQTPGYKAKRLDEGTFKEKMGEAFEDMESKPVRVMDIPDRVDFDKEETFHIREPEVPEGDQARILRHDLNNVSIDQEMVQMAKNSESYMLLTEQLTQQFDMLEQAIQTQARG